MEHHQYARLRESEKTHAHIGAPARPEGRGAHFARLIPHPPFGRSMASFFAIL